MSPKLRILVGAFGDPGHAFPAIALARELQGRGHEVVVETWEQWRAPVEELGLGFAAAEAYKIFPPPPPDAPGPTAADAASALMPLFDELDPDLVVSDILTLAPTLAAEVAGRRLATLIPHVFPVHDPGMPFFSLGAMPPRTGVGKGAWNAGLPLLEAGLRRGRKELNASRGRLGLAPQERFHGGISDGLALVATFPQLEYPRDWPPHVQVTGPMFFELPHPDVELPEGDDPLVLVAPSTSQDPDCRLVRVALEALADEPVRVIATTNRHDPGRRINVPANARLVNWISYTQALAEASLVVCHGGHGTVARALDAGVPVLACPAVGDMAETGARLAWAGAGLSLPWRLTRTAPLRWAARRILGDPAFAVAAGEIATWSRSNSGSARAANLVEEYARQGKS